MKTLKINLGENSYPIYIGKGILENVGELMGKHLDNSNKLYIITDTNTSKYYLDKVMNILKSNQYEVGFSVVPAGEKSKDISTLPAIYQDLVNFKLTRSDAIVALGGGVVGDLAGFVASTFLRGVKFVQIPTSLLSQVDSSVGGKVAVDLKEGKNLVGSFYHPKLVIIDPDVLKTLEPKFISDGLGEVIKYAFIKDYNLYKLLLEFKDTNELLDNITDIIFTCCDIKRIVVENDERDTGERMILNFGHTLGHAIETVCGYETYTHGQGVAIGMYQITKLSENKGLTDKGVSSKILELLKKYDLPYDMPNVPMADILNVMTIDKKNLNSKLNLILLKKIGECFIYQGNIDFFKECTK
ncbi:3-dehydroquinate synthase [Candidatus Epulonipiscium fishelsonii]|uniref:3-dehydroquinate synthase n=1 Tax=Candidatus Epulonipiscium fishelsonii TaxID=77094 RepID=A0ACC8XAX1_9FIRM|nr:3-dehydroquinate synthase [Epulopiscium sp. SCG-B05WGA-EpuloA1]ONI39498.1 3-dehydroquinate synthase [Epulopiscium sp. SCG-B11WGA-EpuloA1]